MVDYVKGVFEWLVQYSVVFFSLTAGFFWVKSARGRTPTEQSTWNARAAISAALAAVYQAIAFFKATPFPPWPG
jgi:hypothetical protein